MSARILIASAIIVTIMLMACGGGGSSNSSPTAEPTPSPTPEPVPCTPSNLSAALVSADPASGGQLLTIGISNPLTNCTLSGSPTVNWYDAAGTKLEVPAATNVRCQPQAGDFSTCVFEGEVLLLGGGATPAAGVSGQAIAVIGVQPADACASPSETAHFVGLQFPGVSPDVRIELIEDVAVPTCGESISLQGFGVLPTPQE